MRSTSYSSSPASVTTTPVEDESGCEGVTSIEAIPVGVASAGGCAESTGAAGGCRGTSLVGPASAASGGIAAHSAHAHPASQLRASSPVHSLCAAARHRRQKVKSAGVAAAAARGDATTTPDEGTSVASAAAAARDEGHAASRHTMHVGCELVGKTDMFVGVKESRRGSVIAQSSSGGGGGCQRLVTSSRERVGTDASAWWVAHAICLAVVPLPPYATPCRVCASRCGRVQSQLQPGRADRSVGCSAVRRLVMARRGSGATKQDHKRGHIGSGEEERGKHRQWYGGSALLDSRCLRESQSEKGHRQRDQRACTQRAARQLQAARQLASEAECDAIARLVVEERPLPTTSIR